MRERFICNRPYFVPLSINRLYVRFFILPWIWQLIILQILVLLTVISSLILPLIQNIYSYWCIKYIHLQAFALIFDHHIFVLSISSASIIDIFLLTFLTILSKVLLPASSMIRSYAATIYTIILFQFHPMKLHFCIIVLNIVQMYFK